MVMSYAEQFERAKRWHERFREVTEGRAHDRPVESATDDAYAFFQNCYHVKDWIIEDAAVEIRYKKCVVEQFINESRSLAVCADLCNATKHMVVKHPRSGQLPEFARADIGLDISAQTIGVRFEISTACGARDAFDLATECLSDWDHFRKLTRAEHADLRERNRKERRKRNARCSN